MHKKPSTLALTLGAAVFGSTALTGTASAGENPFALRDLGGGYLQLASNEAGAGAEGRCGASPKGKEGACAGAKGATPAADKAMEGKCGEGKCGASMNMPAPATTPPPAAADKAMEGKCGEGKCGANMPK